MHAVKTVRHTCVINVNETTCIIYTWVILKCATFLHFVLNKGELSFILYSGSCNYDVFIGPGIEAFLYLVVKDGSTYWDRHIANRVTN